MLQPGPAAELSQVYLQRVAQIVEKGAQRHWEKLRLMGSRSAEGSPTPYDRRFPLCSGSSHPPFQTDHATGCQGEAERERCDREVRGGRVQVLPEVGDEVENTCPRIEMVLTSASAKATAR